MTRLTIEQKNAVRGLQRGIKRDQQQQSLSGYAGTGKSTCLRYLADALPDFAVAAYTGKACSILRAKGVGRAQTLHSLLYCYDRDEDGQPTFRPKSVAEIGCAGVIIDEASMVGGTIYADLLGLERPIVLIGDGGQLPPIADTMLDLMRDPTFELTTIHRNAGPVAWFANHLREGRPAHRFSDGGKAVRVIERSKVNERMLTRAADDGQVICGFNKTRVALNQRCRDLMDRTAPLEDGDRLMALQNNAKLGLYNGQQGIARNVNVHRRSLDFETAERVYAGLRYDPDALNAEKPELRYDPDGPIAFAFAYAISCHKAQGDEFGHVLVFEEQYPKLWQAERWSYTAASRARQTVTWAAAWLPPRFISTRMAGAGKRMARATP